ncbi:hypothetical protein [Algicella marina]|uniref:Uncharacterized protein n=1 Tax=Algicella marina TaxID=2683284 RepID=A0A6P1T399_9RHOB|nr:hypothetical protein [Algicella marina]QHQ35936.1 hypothetical protein GO499_12525 [Algicella marina]
MDRSTLTLTIALVLFAAILTGWMLRWAFNLLNPPPPPEPIADSEWAEYAKACEAAREAAEARVAEVERTMGNQLTQTQAELTAAMEGLGDARREARDLQERLDAINASG